MKNNLFDNNLVQRDFWKILTIDLLHISWDFFVRNYHCFVSSHFKKNKLLFSQRQLTKLDLNLLNKNLPLDSLVLAMSTPLSAMLLKTTRTSNGVEQSAWKTTNINRLCSKGLRRDLTKFLVAWKSRVTWHNITTKMTIWRLYGKSPNRRSFLSFFDRHTGHKVLKIGASLYFVKKSKKVKKSFLYLWQFCNFLAKILVTWSQNFAQVYFSYIYLKLCFNKVFISLIHENEVVPPTTTTSTAPWSGIRRRQK